MGPLRAARFASTLLLLLVVASAASAQTLSVGLKGGVPLTDALHVTDRSRYFSNKAPYVLGPALELHLLAGISVEVDALYRRIQYGSTNLPEGTVSRTTGQAWEFPFLLKGRFPTTMLLKPYVAAGISYRRLAHFQQRTSGGSAPSQVVDQPPELTGRNGVGPTVGAGLELRVPLVRLSAEMRYTRWGSSSFRAALGGLVTQLNETDFMLGILF